MDYQFTVNNYNCYIAQVDQTLTLIAENQKLGQIFTRVLSIEDLKTITKDSFFTISTIYQCIQEFFEEKPQTASLSLSSYGRLIYTCRRQISSKRIKVFSFNILLEKRERHSSALSTQEINQKKEGKWKFNPDTSFGLYFLFSNKNKTIANICSVTAKHVPTKQPLPYSRASQISFRVEENEQRGLGFGIAPAEALSKEQPFMNSKAYMYYSGSHVWKSAQVAKINGICPLKGDIVTFFVDTSTGELRVEINGIEVDNYKFDVRDMRTRDFYPFVYKTGSVRVTLL